MPLTLGGVKPPSASNFVSFSISRAHASSFVDLTSSPTTEIFSSLPGESKLSLRGYGDAIVDSKTDTGLVSCSRFFLSSSSFVWLDSSLATSQKSAAPNIDSSLPPVTQ